MAFAGRKGRNTGRKDKKNEKAEVYEYMESC